jgi:hypothetical protein
VITGLRKIWVKENFNYRDSKEEEIMSDTINIEILEDGTISIKTTAISTANHLSADKLLADLESLMGGKMTFQKNPDAPAHVHSHEHAHAGGHHH